MISSTSVLSDGRAVRIEHHAAAVDSDGGQRARRRSMAAMTLSPCPLADQCGDFADLRTNVVQVLGNATSIPECDTLEHRDRGARRVDAGNDRSGFKGMILRQRD